MKEKHTQLWIPLYVDKWIFGSTRLELDPAERGVFLDLILLAAKDNGYLRANETTAYLPRQIAGLLVIEEHLLKSTIKKCVEFGKMEDMGNGIYRINKWEVFQFTGDYKYRIDTGKKTIPGMSSPKNTDCGTEKPGPIRQDRIGEDKIEQDTSRRFVPPSVEQVAEYVATREVKINPGAFVAHYEAKGWMMGKTRMKSWQAAIRTWEHKKREDSPVSAPKGIVHARPMRKDGTPI